MIIERAEDKRPQVWKKVESKVGTWYIPIDIENKGDYVHLSNRNKNGYAGRFIDFELEDGTVDSVQGVWHSNSRSLLENTGIDLTDKHIKRDILHTIYVNQAEVDGVVYDSGWVIGKFDNDDFIKDLAKDFSEPNLHHYSISSGGSSLFQIKKDGVVR